MPSGMIQSFSDAITTQRTVSNLVKLIDPADTPCLTMFGTSMEKVVRMEAFPNHKYEWFEDVRRIRTGTIAEAMDASETDLDLTTGQGALLKPGDVLKLTNAAGAVEKMYISSIATDTATVIRGWGDTSGVTHDNGATWSYLYSARLEGAESNNSPYTVPSNPYNYSQIFHHEILVSGSELNATNRYGIPDKYKYELMKALGGLGGGAGKKGNAGDLMIDLEKTWSDGERIQRASGVAGAMGGFETFVTTNVTDLANEPLDPATFENAVQSAWGYGGKPNVAVVNAWAHRKLTSFYAGAVRTERRDDVGGIVITTIRTHFGDLDILLNRWLPADRIHIVQRDLAGWCKLRDWREEPLAKGGDYVKGQIIGEFGFILTNEKAHAVIKGISTTA